MKEFLKDYFLSYFSQSKAKNIYKRSFLITFINVIILLVSIFLASFLSQEVSFKYFYNHCDSFKNTIANVLPNDIEIKDGFLSTSVVYNSFKNDSGDYISSGYYVIIDSRDPKTTFDDFTFQMVKNSDVAISYEDYLLLANEEKETYSPVITRTGNYLDTISNIPVYESYLDSLENKDEYIALKSKYLNNDISQLEYANSVYLMYGKSYYPEDVYTCDTYGGLPTLRSYYLSSLNTLEIHQGFIFIYKEGMEACFNYNNKTISFYGDYHLVNNIDFLADKTSSIDNLILGIHKSSKTLRSVSYLFVSFFTWFISLIILFISVLVTRFILFIVHKNERHYTLKIMNLMGSFLLFSSVLSVLLFTLLGFVLSRNVIIIACPIFILVLVIIRTLIYYIIEKHPSDVIVENEEN